MKQAKKKLGDWQGRHGRGKLCQHCSIEPWVADLITMVNKMVRESGDPTGFDAGKWLSKWLTTPNPALGGVPPADYMDSGEGRGTVADLLAKMQSGAYT